MRAVADRGRAGCLIYSREYILARVVHFGTVNLCIQYPHYACYDLVVDSMHS